MSSRTERIEQVGQEAATRMARELGLADYLGKLGIFRVLANHPKLAAGVFAKHAPLREGLLAARLRELLIMRIAWLMGSEYEWAQHWDVAAKAGIPPEDVVAVREWKESDRLDAADRAVLAAVDETLLQGGISDQTWSACEANLAGPAELIELVAAIAHWSGFAQIFRNFRLPVEPGGKLWPPDGTAPSTIFPIRHSR
jgi:alkylhydroperoxidase family enzyme